MNNTQKNTLEIPIIIALLWIWQSLEISLFRLPSNGGSLQLIPILVTYVALTRTWGMTTLISFFLIFAQSFVSGIELNLFVAIGLWTALCTKLFAIEFAVEGRQQFMLLSGGAHLFNKPILYVLLRYQNNALPLWEEMKSLILSGIGTLALAYFVFPFLVEWDEYFEHQITDSRDLNPEVLR